MAAVLAGHGSPSVSVAVVERGHVVFSQAMGTSDLAASQAATERTLYRIGSITKMFTAVSVMQLVEEGRLSLDDRLSRFEPSFPDANAITIRELLMHRSGIGDYLDNAISSGAVMRPTTPQAIVAAAARRGLQSTPGTVYSYSNTNYVILGLVVERVSGTPLASYEKQHILEPAAMHETYLAGNLPPGAPVALGYDAESGTRPQNPGDISWYYGCGDIYSTADDLARFDIALMNGTLVRPSTFREMTAAAMPTGNAGESYGLGITTFSFGSRTLEGHHGGLPGFESDDEMIPPDGFALVELGDDFHFATSTILNAALKSLYPDDFAQVAAEHRALVAQEANAAAALTARFTAFFEDVLAGRPPVAEHLAAALQSALTPTSVAAMAAQYGSYGAFQRLVFTGQDRVGPYSRYYYSAVFAHGTQPLMFVLDASGEIAGFFN